MGCSASSPVGVGLYNVPNDEGDLDWSPDQDRTMDHIMDVEEEAVVRAQLYLRHGAGASNSKHHSPRQRQGQRTEQGQQPSSSSCPAAEVCRPRDDLPFGSLCHSENKSPERRPLPPGRTSLGIAMTHMHARPRAVTPTHVQDSNESLMNSILDTSHHEDTPNSPTNSAFANRQWLVFPEHQYDMNTLHPALPPFLGSMYWTAASPSPHASQGKILMPHISSIHENKGEHNIPSLISPSVDNSPMGVSHSGTPFTRFGIQLPDNNDTMNKSSSTKSSHLSQERTDKLILSLNSTEDCESEATSVSYSNDEEDENGHALNAIDDSRDMKLFSPRESVDISHELLDYSMLDESYVLEQKRSHQPPRRLFGQDEDDSFVMNTDRFDESFEEVATPERKRSDANDSQHQAEQTSQGQKLSSILCMAPGMSHITTIPEQQQTTISKPIPPSSPNVATFYGHWGSRRERHVSTLPSPNPGEPIRLRVTDRSGHIHHDNKSGSRIKHTMSSTTHSTNTTPVDSFSYDPYFSNGKYTITLPNGKPYGNGLAMKMGVSGKFMILEDTRGAVLAVIKSRYTHTPSMVVYAPKKRYSNQVPSGHKLTRQASGRGGKKIVAVVDGNNNNGDCEALYPWALISKSGRTMNDDCTVNLVNDGADAYSLSSLTRSRSSTGLTSGGVFNSTPSFRGRHGFDRGLHTHTVVSRTKSATINSSSAMDGSSSSVNNNGGGSKNKICSTSLEEVPCCVIVRDPSNMDAVDITIAPGIDPLLMICYLASHSKMDVEPIMSGF